MRWTVCGLALAVAVGPAFGDAHVQAGPTPRRMSVIAGGSHSINYLLYLPANYDDNPYVRWPLILLLHGTQERGDDLDLLRDQPLLRFAETDAQFPFVVAVPQCPADSRWSPPVLKELLDELEGSLRIDTDRVYLTGFSMGGYGTWDTAEAYPQSFAAIAPICGGGDTSGASRLAELPIWAFHGALDTNVPLSESTSMVDAVKSFGGEAELTVFADLGHECWPLVYEDSRIYLWFLAHSRADKGQITASR